MATKHRLALATAILLAGCMPVVKPPPAPIPVKPVPPAGTLAAAIAASPRLTKLSAAVTTADLAATLAGPGPYTLFAPTDAAFGRLSPGTAEGLMDPTNRTTLSRILKYHIVAGSFTTADLLARLREGGGNATLPTLAGGVSIRLSLTDDVITLTGETGNVGYIEVADQRAANGVLHEVNGVLIPALD